MKQAFRKLAALLLGLVFLGGCAAQPTLESPPPSVDHAALEHKVEDSISTDTFAMDNVRAVLVVVDGQTKLEYYRHGFTAGDHEHVWSVTKSVLSTLIGIAIGEGLIPSLDAPLRELLPEYRARMTATTSSVTLRQLMSQTGGFALDMPIGVEKAVLAGKIDPVAWAVSAGQSQPTAPGTEFAYSNVGSHLVAAVLHSALQRNPTTKGQSVLDYARTKLFDPLGISTRPAVEIALLPDTDVEPTGPGFGWARIHGVELGAFGLRLTAPDMVKLGQLYLADGTWNGKRLLPEGWVAEAVGPSPLNSSYGLLWWRDLDGWVFAARGSEGQRIVVVPDQRAVIVTLCATKDTKFDSELDEIERLIIRILLPALR